MLLLLKLINISKKHQRDIVIKYM